MRILSSATLFLHWLFKCCGSGLRDLGREKFGSGIKIPDHISERLCKNFCVKKLKLSVADPGSGTFLALVPGSGMEKFGYGIRNTGLFEAFV
jgi:hypothetical protein